MQTGPAGMQEWLDKGERHPRTQTTVAWDVGTDTDVQPEMVSFSLERTLVTDQPDGVRLFTGLTSASLKMTMGGSDDAEGDPSKTAAWKYSPVNPNSPLALKTRLGAIVKLQAGLNTADGPMVLPLFTGKLRVNNSKASNRTADLEALDYWESVRGPVTIGTHASEGTRLIKTAQLSPMSPALNGLFLIDEALRQNDIQTAPPTILPPDATHPGTILQVNGYGSHAANVGRLFEVQRTLEPYGYTTPDVKTSGGKFAPSYLYGGRGGYAWDLTGTLGYKDEPLQENPNFVKGGGFYSQYALTDRIDTTGLGIPDPADVPYQKADRRIIMEMWVNEPDSLIGQVDLHTSFYQNADTNKNDSPEMDLVWRDGINGPTYDGGYFMAYRNAGALDGSSVFRSPFYTLPAPGTGWHHMAVDMYWKSDRWKATVYIDGVAQTQCQGTGNGVTMSTVPFDPFSTYREGHMSTAWIQTSNYVGVQAAAIHVVPANYVYPIANRYAWAPQAVLDASLNTLSHIPAIAGKTGADLIKDAVAAEQGTFEFDELAVPRFRNKTRFDLSATPLKTYSSLDAVLDADITEAIDSVRNSITVKAKHPVLNRAPYELWRADTLYSVPPRSNLVFTVTLSKPAVGLRPFWNESGYDGVQMLAGNQIVDIVQYSFPPILYSATTAADGVVIMDLSNTIQGFTDRLAADMLILDETTLQLTFRNQTGFTYFLNNPDKVLNGLPTFIWEDGAPAIYLFGLQLDEIVDVVVTLDDPISQNQYDLQTYEIPDNPYNQDTASAGDLALRTLSDLRIPRPTIAALNIVPDYRLQTGDLIQVEAEPEVGLNDEWWLIGSTLSGDSNGVHNQQIVLRSAAPRVGWILGRVGRSELGSTTYLV